jgi:hypothetical protein
MAAAVAFANFDFCSPIRKRSPKVAHASFRRPAWPHRTEMRRQHPKRRDENSLRLLLAYRTSAQILSNRPLAHAALQADDVTARTGRRSWRY